MTLRLARWLAWSMVAAYFGLAAAGLTLQALAGRPYVFVGLPGLALMLLLVAIWPVTGALIVSRHPRHPVGWLLCLGILVGPLDMIAAGYAAYDAYVYAGALPGVDLALVWLTGADLPIVLTAFTWLTLLFPSGQVASRGWQRLGQIAGGAAMMYVLLQALEPGPVDPVYLPPGLTNPLAISPTLWRPLEPVMWGAMVALMLSYACAVGGLVRRQRRARGDERQQFKLLTFAVGLFALGLPLLALGLMFDNGLLLNVAIACAMPGIAGIPIATVLAIFRYRLYDVDLIINRALVYGLLTSVLALAYFASVVVLQSLLPAITGQGRPEWVTALSTLVAAALVAPARRGAQRFIDRRFFRARYDAAATLARFAASCGTELDREALEGRLLDVVNETMRPSHASIWHRP